MGTERRQVFDLPPVAIWVTEHLLITGQCACGVRTTGCAPDRLNAPVCYGPRVLAAITSCRASSNSLLGGWFCHVIPWLSVT